ncbi:MAG: hypothetical protein AB7O73_01660 [Bacteroidia bacterium]
MKAEVLNKLIKDPHQMTEKEMYELEKIIVQFPYFHTAHLLLSAGAYKLDPALYLRTVKKSAISVPSRKRLYDLLKESEKIKEELIIEEPIKVEVKEEKIETVEAKTKTEPIIEKEKVEKVLSEEKVKVDINEQVEKEISSELIEAMIEKELQLKSQKITEEEEKKSLETKAKAIPETASFTSWLNHFSAETKGEIQKSESKEDRKGISEKAVSKEKDSSSKLKQRQLIDKIIDMNPGPIKIKTDKKFFSSNIQAKESLLENEHLVTETLADIYASQGNIGKAIRAYEILSLKYPNKSVYFASLIEKLRNKE